MSTIRNRLTHTVHYIHACTCMHTHVTTKQGVLTTYPSFLYIFLYIFLIQSRIEEYLVGSFLPLWT